MQGTILSGNKSEEVQDMLLLDIIPFSLGIATTSGAMTTFFRRNSTIPKKETQVFTTDRDNQKSVDIYVYEGERAMAMDNNLLGKFEITGIPPAPRLSPRIEVTFDMDRNGILNVSVTHKGTGTENKVTVINDKGRLRDDEIEKMVKEAEQYKADDDNQHGRIKSKIKLENFAVEMKSVLEEAIFKCQQVITWVEANETATKEEFDRRYIELKEAFEPLRAKLCRFLTS